MNDRCYFCHGLILSYENDHILLNDHGDHEVYMHERCAIGQNVVEEVQGVSDRIEITCPECGAVELH